ncbi:YciI family protein [Psychrobacter sp.]|uniref:YciI family protein n=1 Tax=Psychrobacter sp. TaxID=56811 RepID=UPI0025E08305|nr:YciI family protein [Psychrobacter sp.]
MPLFMIIGHDVANSTELRQQIRPAHVTRLKQLEAEGRLIIAGPNPIEHGNDAMSGSLIVADFESLQAAQSWVSEEPYLKTGIYSHVDIKPFIKTLPSA